MLRIAVFFILSMSAAPAYAMHIAEGILPLPWALFWWGAALPFVVLGGRRLNRLNRQDLSMKPLVGLLAAVVFVVSCLPIPLPTGTCSHPCGTGISAILLGPLVSALLSSVALLIQALFLAHGGLSTLGANVFAMGVVGSFAGFFAFRGVRRLGGSLAVAAFVAGVAADWGTYATTALALSSGIAGGAEMLSLFWKVLVAFVPTQLPLGILEGAATAGMVTLLSQKRPDLLARMGVVRAGEVADVH